MDQSQFQAYEVAGATDMNRLHQFPQDYFKEVVEGFIGDVSDALFGTAGFSSAIVAGPSIDITVAAQTFAAAGRIGSVGATVVNGVSTAPANTQRFYVYLDIQETEVTESRDIANPGTGVKTPTMIVTHKTTAASIVVIQVDDGDPEAPPPLGVISPGVERLGFIQLGYVDYNQNGASNVDVFNSAAIFSAPGSPNLSLVSLDDLGDVTAPTPATGDLLQKSAGDWVNVTVQDTIGDTLRQVNGLRLSSSAITPITPDSGSTGSIYATNYTSPNIALYDGTKYVLKSTPSIALVLAGLTAGLPYDVFAYLSAGTPTLELEAWTNQTLRAVAINRTGGVVVKSTDQTRRYLGTIVPDSAATIGFSARRKPIWNYYNRVNTRALVAVAGLSYLIPDTSPNYRLVNLDLANILQVCVGVQEDAAIIQADGNFSLTNNAGAANPLGIMGIGFDSGTVNGAQSSNMVALGAVGGAVNVFKSVQARYVGSLAEGYRQIFWLEYADLDTTGTVNFFSGAAPFSPASISMHLPM